MERADIDQIRLCVRTSDQSAPSAKIFADGEVGLRALYLISMKKPDLPEWVEPPCWRLSPPRDFCEFLRELPGFMPENSILALEGPYATDIETYLQERPAKYENETDQGFWKMRPKIFYMTVTLENLRGLADLSERHNELEVCSHLRVFSSDQIMLSWHDLPTDPIYVSDRFDEVNLKRVCDVLGCDSLSYASCGKEL